MKTSGFHPRVERDLEAVNAKSSKARVAGKASGMSRRTNVQQTTNERSTNVQRTLNHTEADTEQKQNRKERSKPLAPSSHELNADASPVVATLPCDGKTKQWHVTEAMVGEWRRCFPVLDVMQEVRGMYAWIRANPTKRKTQRGMPAFAANWLNRAQNRTSDRGSSNGKSQTYRSKDERTFDAVRESIEELSFDHEDAGVGWRCAGRPNYRRRRFKPTRPVYAASTCMT